MELPVFFGKKIKYQHPCVWSPLKNDSLELYELHVSQLALGPTAKGKHILVCKVSGEDGESESMVLATLSHDTNIPQMSVRLSFTEHVEFALVQGSGPLYMTGTTTLIDVDTERLAVLGDEDFEDDGEDNDENDDDDGEDGSDGDNISNSIDELTNELLAGISDSDSQDLKMSKKGMQLLREAALNEHHRISDEYTRGYIGSKDEAKDVIRNWTFCGGNWDFVLQFQPASSEEDIPRFTKIVETAVKAGEAPKFSKKEKKARRAVLIEKMEEVSLDDDDNDDDEEDEGDDADMDGFIADGDDDDDDDDSDSDDDEEEGTEEDGESVEDDEQDDDDEGDANEDGDDDDDDDIEDENMEILASSYRDSSTEREDLLANWNKFGGNWDLILEFQPLKEQERLQKMINQLVDSKKAKKFSKKEQAKIRKEAEAWLEKEGIVLSKDERDESVDDVESMFEKVGKESENEEDDDADEGDEEEDSDEEGDDDEEEDDDSEDSDEEETEEHPGLKDLEKAHLRRQSQATPQKSKPTQQPPQPRSGKRKGATSEATTPRSGKKHRGGSK